MFLMSLPVVRPKQQELVDVLRSPDPMYGHSQASRLCPPPENFWSFMQKQDNVHTNAESVQCISIVYSICPYEYNQWAV